MQATVQKKKYHLFIWCLKADGTITIPKLNIEYEKNITLFLTVSTNKGYKLKSC